MTLVLPDEVNQLSRLARLVGCDDPVRYLREIAWVDIDLIRKVGRHVWGAGGVKAHAQAGLEAGARRLVEDLYISVQDRWEGTAYTQFEGYLRVIEGALAEEAERLQPVGSALVALADAFEVHWYESLGYVLAAAGLITAIIGMFFVETGAGLVLAVIGLLTSVVGVLVAEVAALKPRLDAVRAATARADRLRGEMSEVDRLAGDDVPGHFPSDISAWRPRAEAFD